MLSVALQAAASCPLLLSRQAPKDRNAVPSWTIIIPAGWVCPIWQALIHQGARPNCPAGQTEWHWASMQQVLNNLEAKCFCIAKAPQDQCY